VVIHRPVGEVFAFLADIENWAKLQLTLRESQEASPGPGRVGDTFLQTIEIPGQLIELLCRVTGLEEDERVSLEYSWNQLLLWIDFVFEPLDGGTKLTSRGEGRIGGFLSLFEAPVNSEIEAQLRTNLNNLRSLLESRANGGKQYSSRGP
jgi:Polyketide cyclase / dehydrase and lipid transport